MILFLSFCLCPSPHLHARSYSLSLKIKEKKKEFFKTQEELKNNDEKNLGISEGLKGHLWTHAINICFPEPEGTA